MEFNGRLIHFTGIGGVSMSALACFAILNGAYVTGSDINAISERKKLENFGIKCYIGSEPGIAANADFLVYTSAVGANDPEVIGCINKGIPVMPRHQFLAAIAEEYRDVIAVSGTHGKTTVTSMISAIMKKADYPFAAHIGGFSRDIGGNFYHKGNELLVTEACEYKRSFLSLRPTLAVILNIDNDHPDTYKSRAELYKAFYYFADVADVALVYAGFAGDKCANEHIVTFGFDNTADFYPENIKEYANEKYHFDICFRGHTIIPGIRSPQYGMHNVLNAVTAGAAAAMWGIPYGIIGAALSEFRGVGRRFERKGCINGAEVYCDYAHHPTAVKAVVGIARGITRGRVITVFEPHTFTRTKALIKEFAECFDGSDMLILLPTYAARETAAEGMDTDEILKRINNVPALAAKDYYEAMEIVLSSAGEGDTVLILGAGSVVKLGDMLTYVPLSPPEVRK